MPCKLENNSVEAEKHVRFKKKVNRTFVTVICSNVFHFLIVSIMLSVTVLTVQNNLFLFLCNLKSLARRGTCTS